MTTLFHLLFFALAHAAATDIEAASSLRGSRQFQPDDSVICRVSVFGTSFAEEQEDPTEHSQIKCIPIVNGDELDFEVPLEFPMSFVEEHKAEIEQGTLIISVSNARLSVDDWQIELHQTDSEINVIEDQSGKYRHLQERHRRTEGVLKVAVIRVTTTDSGPQGAAASVQSITNTMFTNGINFVSQYDACSFGKLKWQLAEPVFEVKLPGSLATYNRDAATLVTAVQQQLKSQRGLAVASDLADKVIMCLPPGTGDWAASAGVNHWRAQMNNEWCTSLSGTMHELGHTLGLLHSNANGVAYADRSGYMGSGYTDTVKPRKCFNGYQSHHFGWYSDKEVKVNPVSKGELVRLAAFVDYDKAASNESVLINVLDKYFLLFNRAELFNQETEQLQNLVTITEPLSTGTEMRGGLGAGQSYDIPNFQGSGQTLKIKVCREETGQGSSADVMVVSIAMNSDLCNAASIAETPSQATNKQSSPIGDRPPQGASKSEVLRWLIAYYRYLRP